MLRVGLTGGIGSGKSTVARRLAELGAVVVDADRLAREAVAPGSRGLAAVVTRFGADVVAPDGSLDRSALGRLVFADERARADLESITHPLVAQAAAAAIAAAPVDAVVVHDVPLLVEKAMGSAYHLVLVVGADERTRIERLVRDRGMSEADAAARIAAQASDDQRRAAADVWLDNDGPVDALVAEADELWSGRLAGFEANLQSGAGSRRPEVPTPVPTPDPAPVPTLVPPDPTWPAQAARLASRIARALGGQALAVEHIGGTAVPGLPATDVVDLQVAVASLADADRPAFVAAMARQGFPRSSGDAADTPLDAADTPLDAADRATATGSAWSERLHDSADPGRTAHVHVREVSGPGWRRALLLRDWFRADAEARDAYAREKQRLVAACATAAEYAAAKDSCFAAVLPEAERWAAESGWWPR